MESMITTVGFKSSATASISLTCVSASTYMSPSDTPRRCARSLSCLRLSSPVTYSTRSLRPIRPQSCSSSVDLPTPGAPPTSTTLPRTAPPPRTLSSSPTPVVKRISSSASRSESFSGACLALCAAAAALFSFFGRVGASVSVFHAPQAGHCPDQRAVSLPHSVQ